MNILELRVRFFDNRKDTYPTEIILSFYKGFSRHYIPSYLLRFCKIVPSLSRWTEVPLSVVFIV
jgi:hypothetical protein